MRLRCCLIPFVLALAGCTAGGEHPSTPVGTTPSTASASPVQSETVASPSPASTGLPVIATRAASIRGSRATITLNEVEVRDGLTSLTWTVTNTGDPTTTLHLTEGVPIGQSVFSDGRRATVPGSGAEVVNDLSYADGVFLIDGVNQLRYLPARDSEGTCACSRSQANEFLTGGQSHSFSAVFRGLPAGVETIAVSIPLAGNFTRVPVQR